MAIEYIFGECSTYVLCILLRETPQTVTVARNSYTYRNPSLKHFLYRIFNVATLSHIFKKANILKKNLTKVLGIFIFLLSSVPSYTTYIHISFHTCVYRRRKHSTFLCTEVEFSWRTRGQGTGTRVFGLRLRR